MVMPAEVVPGQTPIPTLGGDLRLPIAVLPLAAHDGGADQADLAASITEMAIALNRNATNAYDMLGVCKLLTGAIGDVIPLEERAIRLDPLDSFAGAYYQRIGIVELFQSHIGQARSLFEKARTAYATRQNEWGIQADSWLAAADALNGETSRAADALAEARKSSEYPASIVQYRRQAAWHSNPTVQAWADATYFKGLRLAGFPEE